MSTEIENEAHEEILTPEETDALIQGIDDGTVPLSSENTNTGVATLYDFAECDRLSRGSMPTLQIINTRIARMLRDSLSDFLRRPVEVEAAATISRRFGEHMPTLQMPSFLNLVRVSPLPGTMLVVPDTRLILMTVDCFFGGKGNVPKEQPVREFTQVETRMMSLLLERIFEAVSKGWEPVIALQPELIGQEQNPQFAAIASSNEQVIISEFIIALADEQMRLQMIIPRVLLEPVEEMLDSAPRNDDGQDDSFWNSAVKGRLEDIQIGLQSTLTQTVLRLGDILSLQPGDVIPVSLPEQVMLEAAGTPVFAARIGTSRNRNAVEIVSTLNNQMPAILNRESH